MQSTFELAAKLFGDAITDNAKVVLFPTDAALKPYEALFDSPVFKEIVKNHVSVIPLRQTAPVYTSINGVLLGADPNDFVATVIVVGHNYLTEDLSSQVIYINRVIITPTQSEMLLRGNGLDSKALSRDAFYTMITNGLQGKALVAFCGANKDVRTKLCKNEGNAIQRFLANRYQIIVPGANALSTYKDIFDRIRPLVIFNEDNSTTRLFPEMTFRRIIIPPTYMAKMIAQATDGSLYEIIPSIPQPAIEYKLSKVNLNIGAIDRIYPYLNNLYIISGDNEYNVKIGLESKLITENGQMRTGDNDPDFLTMEPSTVPGMKIQTTRNFTNDLYGIVADNLWSFNKHTGWKLIQKGIKKVIDGSYNFNSGGAVYLSMFPPKYDTLICLTEGNYYIMIYRELNGLTGAENQSRIIRDLSLGSIRDESKVCLGPEQGVYIYDDNLLTHISFIPVFNSRNGAGAAVSTQKGDTIGNVLTMYQTVSLNTWSPMEVITIRGGAKIAGQISDRALPLEIGEGFILDENIYQNRIYYRVVNINRTIARFALLESL